MSLIRREIFIFREKIQEAAGVRFEVGFRIASETVFFYSTVKKRTSVPGP